ncbi:conjugal transfer protein TraI [Mucilaginibacter sp. McL0603]|uniref:conjugal transfer protein TraI n=1 Tax=Mucilaginibacter sp. McL0603 TaxID=3415670 RepID=UPI003CEADE24
MKKKIRTLYAALTAVFFFLISQTVSAQVPVVGLVTGIIKKVIIAIDLKVQELQNQTIALQNAEQSVENDLSLNQLTGISGWLNKERSLYQDYYKELASVKTIISDYDEVKRIITTQAELVSEYHNASALFHNDPHFSAAELRYMETIYSGILQESLRSLEQAELAVKSFSTQMNDAERIKLVHQSSGGMQTNLDHLRQFNSQNIALSLGRARDEQDRQNIKSWYGLQ